MGDQNRLGKNIRSLRVAFGETQEELGDAIHVEKTAISNYERGARIPDGNVIQAISEHYTVSVEELTLLDFSDTETISFDPYAFCKNIDTALPVVVSDKALSNESFKKANQLHKECFDKIKKMDFDHLDLLLEPCMDLYSEAYESETAEEEAAANLWGLLLFFMLQVKAAPILIKQKPAHMLQAMVNDKYYEKIVNSIDPKFEVDAKEAAKDLEDPEFTESFSELKKIVKKSLQWGEVADYYLALQYCWNIVDNGLSRELNGRIGSEMLETFISVGNKYAARYYLLVLKAMGKRV